MIILRIKIENRVVNIFINVIKKYVKFWLLGSLLFFGYGRFN